MIKTVIEILGIIADEITRHLKRRRALADQEEYDRIAADPAAAFRRMFGGKKTAPPADAPDPFERDGK